MIQITLKQLLTVAGFTLFILVIPFIAMGISDQVNWSGMDFLVAGILVSGLGMSLAIIRNGITNKGKRLIIIALVLFTFILLWLELAVGIFGSVIAGS
ncbi:hypothetical protein [Luteibaculum oceani]|uniref:Uncharacterized protein n=1 Tax=Luteibaculum oceani TaxID=1294296 RepID=A0A5C6UR04_9FLAO|nr:hypothetical protein [Luteibaculum oceani]TXC75647.1 hypothetical protein FRX97_11540 [Luteibaculum oceani]